MNKMEFVVNAEMGIECKFRNGMQVQEWNRSSGIEFQEWNAS